MAGRWHSNHVDTTLGMLGNDDCEQLMLNQMNRGSMAIPTAHHVLATSDKTIDAETYFLMCAFSSECRTSPRVTESHLLCCTPT
jgi:hypothetical protein